MLMIFAYRDRVIEIFELDYKVIRDDDKLLSEKNGFALYRYKGYAAIISELAVNTENTGKYAQI